MAVSVNFYNSFIEDIGLQRMNLSTDTFKVILVNGYVFNATHASKASISSELGTGNGYTSGGETLDQTWSFSSGLTKFDANDVSWLVDVGGTIGPCTGAIIYNDTSTDPTDDRLVCYIDFGATETAGASTEFKIVFDTNGIFTIG